MRRIKPLRGCETLETDRTAEVVFRGDERGCLALIMPKGSELHESGEGCRRLSYRGLIAWMLGYVVLDLAASVSRGDCGARVS